MDCIYINKHWILCVVLTDLPESFYIRRYVCPDFCTSKRNLVGIILFWHLTSVFMNRTFFRIPLLTQETIFVWTNDTVE